MIEEETVRRVEEAIRERVEAELKSDAVKAQITAMIEEGRKRLEGEVQAQLEAEKQALLEEARRKEVGHMLCLSICISIYGEPAPGV